MKLPHIENSADWVSWTLQFLCGAILGALATIFDYGTNRGFRFGDESVMMVLGGALIGGALASYFGDFFWYEWIGRTYRLIPPDAPQHNILSKGASILAGVAGGVFLLVG